MEITRRAFSTVAVAAALEPSLNAKSLEPLSPGIKISVQVDESVSDEDLTWIKQMGVNYLNVRPEADGPLWITFSQSRSASKLLA